MRAYRSENPCWLYLSAGMMFFCSIGAACMIIFKRMPSFWVAVLFGITSCASVVMLIRSLYMVWQRSSLRRKIGAVDETTRLLPESVDVESGCANGATSIEMAPMPMPDIRKSSKPRPIPKQKTPYKHPTPRKSRLMDRIMPRFVAWTPGHVHPRRHTVSEGEASTAAEDNPAVNRPNSSRVHTTSESAAIDMGACNDKFTTSSKTDDLEPLTIFEIELDETLFSDERKKK